MNSCHGNLRALEELRCMASVDWAQVPNAHYAGKQAVKMEAALQMVLAFYASGSWSSEWHSEWIGLQVDAGREFPDEGVTTKILCNTIREVLGIQEESHSDRAVI